MFNTNFVLLLARMCRGNSCELAHAWLKITESSWVNNKGNVVVYISEATCEAQSEGLLIKPDHDLCIDSLGFVMAYSHSTMVCCVPLHTPQSLIIIANLSHHLWLLSYSVKINICLPVGFPPYLLNKTFQWQRDSVHSTEIHS